MAKKVIRKKIGKKKKECVDNLNFTINASLEFIKRFVILMLRIT